MCCFSVPTLKSFFERLFAPKVHVSATNIFARMTAAGVQAIAYSMNLSTAREVAMILPVPVRPGMGEGALRFINLEKHPNMFGELSDLFDIPPPQSRGAPSRQAVPQAKTLTVHK